MKLLLYTLLCIILFPLASHAQYTQQGTITYERKVNTYSEIEEYADGNSEWLEQVKTRIPKFKMAYFQLSFNLDKTLYTPIKKDEDKDGSWWSDFPGSANTVFTDLKTGQVTASKLIFEKTFLVKDSMRKMQWKITSEIRTIGEFKCRKAVGKICDSVYVVAFYTDDIMVSGGPEMFGGLPGMILELAIPRLHTTWTATKVEITPPKPEDMIAPEKGKQVTEKGLYETLKDSFSDWGKHAGRNIWWSVL